MSSTKDHVWDLLLAPLPSRVNRGIRRRLGLPFESQRQHVRRILKLPDRHYLEDQVLPWLVAPGSVLLSIGTREYTVPLENVVEGLGGRLITVDIDPEAARFGARTHICADVSRLQPGDLPEPVNAVLFNGVIGWGLDQPDDIRCAVASLGAILPPSARMVVGWNTDRSMDPFDTVPDMAQVFSHCPGPDGRERVSFDGVTHIYDFLERIGD